MSKYLLDTHTLIWFAENMKRLTVDENIHMYEVECVW